MPKVIPPPVERYELDVLQKRIHELEQKAGLGQVSVSVGTDEVVRIAREHGRYEMLLERAYTLTWDDEHLEALKAIREIIKEGLGYAP